MSWSEKVTRYKGEQETQKQLKVQAEQQRALRGYKEYLQRWETSLSLLDKFGIKDSLTQIRDEVWQEGEVICVFPLSLDEYTKKQKQSFRGAPPSVPEYEKLAEYFLRYESAVYIGATVIPNSGVGDYPERYSDPEIGIGIVVDLSVGVVVSKSKEFFFNVSNLLTDSLDHYYHDLSKKVLIPTSSPLAKEDIEKALLENCARRPSYREDRSFESTDPRILDLVLEGKEIPPGFEFLVDFAQQYAKKKRQAARDAEAKEQAATRPKRGWFR